MRAARVRLSQDPTARRRASDYYHRDYALRPEKYAQYRRTANLNLKRRALELLGGARCVRCGCDNLLVLEVNHKNGGGSMEFKKRRSHSGGPTYGLILKGLRETDDLEVLCRPCNAIDYIERRFPHLVGRLKVTWLP